MEDRREEKDYSPGNKIGFLIVFGLIALFVAGVALAIAEQPWNPDSRAESLAENPQNFYGRMTSVNGQVGQVIGSRAFTLNAPDDVGGEILVISRNPNVPIGGGPNEYIYNINDSVRVRGQVQEFNLQSIEQELGTDLVDTNFAVWQGRPVIIADTVERNF